MEEVELFNNKLVGGNLSCPRLDLLHALGIAIQLDVAATGKLGLYVSAIFQVGLYVARAGDAELSRGRFHVLQLNVAAADDFSPHGITDDVVELDVARTGNRYLEVVGVKLPPRVELTAAKQRNGHQVGRGDEKFDVIAAIHKVGEPHLIVHVEAQGGAVVSDDDFVGNRHRRLHTHRNGIALRVLHVEKAEHLYSLEGLNKIGGVLDDFRLLGLLGNFYHTRSEGTHYGKRCYEGKDMAFFKISKIHNEDDLMDCFYSLDAKGLEKVAREMEKNGN